MPATFLLFLMFVFFAFTGPVAILGAAGAMCTRKWRRAGCQAAQFGLACALLFYAAAEFLLAMLGERGERSALILMAVASAGFTTGIVMMFLWKKGKRFFPQTRAGSPR